MKSGNECRDGLSLHAGTWTVSVLLLGNSLCRGLRAKRGPDCNAVVVGGFFYTLESLSGPCLFRSQSAFV